MDLAAVSSGRIQDRTLTLAPSGWTYNNTFVLYDKETVSLWYPMEGGLKAVQGAYFGEVFAEVSSEDTRWRPWVGRHPHSKILK